MNGKHPLRKPSDFTLSPVGLALPEACADNAATFYAQADQKFYPFAQRELGCASKVTCRIEETAFSNGYRRIRTTQARRDHVH